MVRKAVIPVAGLGTRFLPATKDIPKEMLPIVDTPIIQYIVAEAVASGIEEILLVTGRSKRAIEDHFDVSPELEAHLEAQGKDDLLNVLRQVSDWVKLHFIRQKRPRGLGDAIAHGRVFVGDEPFAVMLGDEIFHGDPPCLAELLEAYRETRGSVVAYQEVPEEQTRLYGIIDPEPVGPNLVKARDMVEKPEPADAPSRLAIIGRYVLEPEVFGYLATLTPGHGGEIQLTDALRRMAVERGVYGRAVNARRYDVGSKLGYLQANVEYGLRHPEVADSFAGYLRDLLQHGQDRPSE